MSQQRASTPRHRLALFAAVLSVGTALALGGCRDLGDAGPTSPVRVVPTSTTADPGTVRVCNDGEATTFGTTARLGVVLPSVSLADGHCAVVWDFAGADDVTVTSTADEDPAVQTDAIALITGGTTTVFYEISTLTAVGNHGVDFVFFTSFRGPDDWETTKQLITSCEDFNAWLAKVKAALEAYKAALTGNTPFEQGARTAAERALENLVECTSDADLQDKKDSADRLLRPLKVIKTAAKLWATGFELYAAVIDLIVKSLSNPVGVPFDVINKALDFIIAGMDAVGNREGAQKAREVKELKDKVKNGLETIEKLKEALEALRPLVVPPR